MGYFNNKVSVIIPTYKRSDTLCRAINSVLFQTYKNIEIIVVDDNDGSSIYRKENEEKISIYKSNINVIYLKHEKNLNGAAARNTGIKKASGDYITFLDDDDYFLPTRIEKMVDLLEKNKEYDGAFSSVLYETNSKITNILHAKNSGNMQLELLKGKPFFGTGSNILLRKRAVDKVGLFDVNFKRHQDLEYMVRFFQYYKIINIDEPLVVKNSDSRINRQNFDQLLKTKIMYLNKFENFISNYSVEEQNSIYFNQYRISYFYLFDDKLKEREIIKKMEKYGKVSKKIYVKHYLRKLINKYKSFEKLKDLFNTLKTKSFLYQNDVKDYKKIIDH